MENEPGVVDGQAKPLNLQIISRIWMHYRARPWWAHFGAWMIVGLTLGFLLAPDIRLSSLFGFAIAGCLCCSLLALLTYPVSDHYRLTLVGALAGLLLAPLGAWIATPVQSDIAVNQLGLIAGALLGATSLVWLTPMRFLGRLMYQETQTVAFQDEPTPLD